MVLMLSTMLSAISILGCTCIASSATAFGISNLSVIRKPHHRSVVLPTGTLHSSLVGDDAFDFSSTRGWDAFYTQSRSSQEHSVLEWHSSVPLEKLAGRVPLKSRCLMVGCGTSDLPSVVYADRHAHIILLDSSQTCIDHLSARYGEDMTYLCADATKLAEFVPTASVDIIVDKGLMDALFCGEGWNGPIDSMVRQASKVLYPGGMYLLVSYRLMQSTKEFLAEVGDEVGLDWEFDCAGSNERVGISIARRRI